MPEIVYLYASIRDELKTQKVKPQQVKCLKISDSLLLSHEAKIGGNLDRSRKDEKDSCLRH